MPRTLNIPTPGIPDDPMPEPPPGGAYDPDPGNGGNGSGNGGNGASGPAPDGYRPDIPRDDRERLSHLGSREFVQEGGNIYTAVDVGNGEVGALIAGGSDLTGRQAFLPQGTWELPYGTLSGLGLHDRISSVKVADGYMLRLWMHQSDGVPHGSNVVVVGPTTAELSDLNDEVSNVWIKRTSTALSSGVYEGGGAIPGQTSDPGNGSDDDPSDPGNGSDDDPSDPGNSSDENGSDDEEGEGSGWGVGSLVVIVLLVLLLRP